MERKKYLELCQKNAILNNIIVECSGIEYSPVAYELSFGNDGNLIHRAILKDTIANCIVYAKLADVEEVKQC